MSQEFLEYLILKFEKSTVSSSSVVELLGKESYDGAATLAPSVTNDNVSFHALLNAMKTEVSGEHEQPDLPLEESGDSTKKLPESAQLLTDPAQVQHNHPAVNTQEPAQEPTPEEPVLK